MSTNNPGTIATGGPADSGQSQSVATQGEPQIWTSEIQPVQEQGEFNNPGNLNTQQSVQQNPFAQFGLEKFKDLSGLAEGYKNIESQYTQISQENAQLKQQYEQLVEQALMGMAQQQQHLGGVTQQQAQQVADYLRMNPGDFWNAVNEKPHEVLPSVVKSILENESKGVLERLTKLESQAQVRFNQFDELQTQANYVKMRNNYQKIDPDFDSNIQKAAQFLLSPQGKSFLVSNPTNGLELAYKIQLAERINDQNWVQKMGQAYQTMSQQHIQQTAMANPMTSSPNMSAQPNQFGMPNPVPGNPGAQNAAKNIAAFNEPFGLPNFNVVY